MAEATSRWYTRPLTRFVFRAIVAALTLLASTSCVPYTGEARNNNVDSRIEATPLSTDIAHLEGTTWILASFVGPGGPLTIPETLTATLKFEDGSYEFNAGCNPVFGEYDMNQGVPKIKTVVMRSINCEAESNGVEAMALENALADSIATWSTYSIANKELHIVFEDGELYFQRAPASSMPTARATPSVTVSPTATQRATTEPTAIPSPSAPAPTLTPPPLPPGWAWHAVARYGYGVPYPDTWTVRTRSATSGIVHETTFRPPADGPAMGVVVDVWKPPDDPAFDLLEWVNANPDATIRVVLDEPLTYNATALGRPAVYYFHADDGRTTNMATVLFATEQGRFRVTMSAPSPLSEEAMPIYRTMLASFAVAGEAEVGVVIP